MKGIRERDRESWLGSLEELSWISVVLGGFREGKGQGKGKRK